MTIAKIRWVVSTILCMVTLGVASGQKISFPGTKSEVKSHDGRYIVRNQDDEKQQPAHTLTLVDTKDNSATKVYSYSRHVEVLWSPTSDAFVVNDYEGSDISRPVLFTAPWTGQPVDLREKLIDFLRSGRGAKSVLENHHVYFSVRRWLHANEILCRLTGYGDADPKGFTSDYVYKIGDGFRPH